MNSGMFRIAVVGAATLKGRELADVLNERKFPARDIKLLDDDESLGQLEAVGDEVSFVQSVRPEHFENVDFAFFTSDGEFTRKNAQMAQGAGALIVDLSYALEGDMGATIRSPWLERELKQSPPIELQPGPVVPAHPAAQALALLMVRIQKAGAIRTSAVTIFEPASEHGRRGMDELHEQTVNLLSFRELPKEVYQTQVAFNVIARYGDGSRCNMETVERRIAGHYRRITNNRAPVPSLMLVQAPSFHGHVFSLYVELENAVGMADLNAALSGDHVEIARTAEESPSNVTAAGQEDVVISLHRDHMRENGFWIWGAIDNLRLASTTAVECAETMLAARPRGKVQ